MAPVISDCCVDTQRLMTEWKIQIPEQQLLKQHKGMLCKQWGRVEAGTQRGEDKDDGDGDQEQQPMECSSVNAEATGHTDHGVFKYSLNNQTTSLQPFDKGQLSQEDQQNNLTNCQKKLLQKSIAYFNF